MEGLSIKNIIIAFADAQLEFTVVVKGTNNPFFKSKYAELPAFTEMIKPILKEHRLAYTQETCKDGDYIGVQTILYHTSGECLKSGFLYARPIKYDKEGNERVGGAQEVGSAITYLRRYSLTTFLGLVAEGEDDDGNKASPQQKPAKTTPKKDAPPKKDTEPPEEVTEVEPFGDVDKDTEPVGGTLMQNRLYKEACVKGGMTPQLVNDLLIQSSEFTAGKTTKSITLETVWKATDKWGGNSLKRLEEAGFLADLPSVCSCNDKCEILNHDDSFCGFGNILCPYVLEV